MCTRCLFNKKSCNNVLIVKKYLWENLEDHLTLRLTTALKYKKPNKTRHYKDNSILKPSFFNL